MTLVLHSWDPQVEEGNETKFKEENTIYLNRGLYICSRLIIDNQVSGNNSIFPIHYELVIVKRAKSILNKVSASALTI